MNKDRLLLAQSIVSNLIAGARVTPDGAQEVAQLQVTLQQAIEEAGEAVQSADDGEADTPDHGAMVLAAIAADIKALREAAGV